jgi:Flp pilus assembly protein TadG
MKNDRNSTRTWAIRAIAARFCSWRSAKSGTAPRLKGLSRRLFASDAGGPLVEFALVLPMMLIVVTGIFYLGIALALYLQLTNATEIGAQLLSVSRGQTTDPCNTTVTAIENAAPNLATGSLTFSYTIDGESYSGSTCTAGAAYMIQGASATVTATYPVHLGIYKQGWSTITLKAQTTELIQ